MSGPTENVRRRPRDARRGLAMLLTTALLLAAGVGVGPGDTAHAAAAPTAADPALRSAPVDRLDRVADGLRRSPLAVDPELDWLVDAGTRRELLRTLRGTDVPVLVAVVPLETEDESGGDADRVLRGLQQRLRRDALYVVINPDGQIDHSALGIDRDPDVPFELRYPPTRGTRREGAPLVNLFDSVPGRLAQLVRFVDRAPRTGTPAPGVTSVMDLSTLPSDYDYSYEDDEGSTVGYAVLLAVAGVIVGLLIARRRIRRDTGRRTKDGRAAERRERAERRRRGRPGDSGRRGAGGGGAQGGSGAQGRGGAQGGGRRRRQQRKKNGR